MGVSHSCVAKWELNVWTMSVEVAAKLAEIFNIDVNELIIVDSDFKSIGNRLDESIVHTKPNWRDRCF